MVVFGAAALRAEGRVDGHRVRLRAADRDKCVPDVASLRAAHGDKADKQRRKDGEESADLHCPRVWPMKEAYVYDTLKDEGFIH